MEKKLLISLFLFHITLLLSQNYQWQWAKQGGGNSGNSVFTSTSADENIKAITTDSNGNYYFLTWIYDNQPIVNDTSVALYGRRDLLLYSTDCSGNLRWKTVIGGYTDSEFAMKIEVDDNGGIYLMANLSNNVAVNSPSNFSPTHLDSNVVLPAISAPASPPYPYGTAIDPAFKTMYFLKYSTSTGNLIWYRALQGDVTFPVGRGDNGLWYMDSNKNIHAILGFYKGTHLDGNITVPNSYDYDITLGNNNVAPQYYLVKFNYNNGNMTVAPNPMVLPITGDFGGTFIDGQAKLLYDESLNRYYIAGRRMYGIGSFEYTNLSYGGVPFNNEGFIFTFDGATGNEIWRKEFVFPYLGPGQKQFDKIFDIKKDQNSNIYICGHYSKFTLNNANGWAPTSTFGGYTLPSTNLYNTIPFVSKINPAGNIVWMTVPSENGLNGTHDDQSLSVNFIGGLAINGNELAFTKGAIREKWGNFPLSKPLNARSDPFMVRLNLDTGAVIATHEIESNYSTEDQITAIAVDKDGNYIVGGFFTDQLFANPNDGIPTLYSTSNSGYSQFFIAKLGLSSSCSLNTLEVSAEDAGITLYPNPVVDVLNIKSKNKLESFELYSSAGQRISAGKMENYNAVINFNSLTSGVYYIKIRTDKSVVTEKVVKK